MKERSSNNAGPRRHLTSKEKAKILKAQERSGLSLLAFARKHELCYASLLRWRARLNSEAPVPTVLGSASHPHFVPVALEREPSDSGYILGWAGGRSLRIPLQFDPDSLQRLLNLLEARP